MDPFTLKRHNSFQNENNTKATLSFSHRPLNFRLQQEVLKFNEFEFPKNWPGDKFWKLRKSNF